MGRAFEFRKTRKLKRWAAMSKAFTRIGKDIVIAVKEGGPDADHNSNNSSDSGQMRPTEPIATKHTSTDGIGHGRCEMLRRLRPFLPNGQLLDEKEKDQRHC